MARIAIAALAACLLTGCGADADSAPTAETDAPGPALRGTTWVVTELVRTEAGVDRNTPVDQSTAQATLSIAEDGAVSGSGGCNRLIGTATVRDESADAATIDFRLGSTRMMCAPDAMAVEDAVLGVLGEGTDALISGDTLTLRAGDGHGLVLVAR